MVCERERFVKGGVLPPEQPDDAKHCLAWFSYRDGEDCYRRGYERLLAALTLAQQEARAAALEEARKRVCDFADSGFPGGPECRCGPCVALRALLEGK